MKEQTSINSLWYLQAFLRSWNKEGNYCSDISVCLKNKTEYAKCSSRMIVDLDWRYTTCWAKTAYSWRYTTCGERTPYSLRYTTCGGRTPYPWRYTTWEQELLTLGATQHAEQELLTLCATQHVEQELLTLGATQHISNPFDITKHSMI
jgi:hypothetical protein